MTRPVTAICNHCQKITDVKFKHKKHPNDIEETFFKCEYCYYHYTAYVKDSKVRKMQRKKDKMTGPNNAVNRLKLQEEINNRMNLLKYNLINYGRADI